jgi:hypothetical protein
MNHQSQFIPRRATAKVLVAFTGIALITSGCSNGTQGAVSGAGIGALSGLAIGSLSGDAGQGAAIGAIAGGIGGAVIGDQNRRRDEATAKQMTAPAPTQSANQPYATGYALGNLVGNWKVNDVVAKDGTTSAQGTAKVVAEKNYFVRMELRFTDPRTGQTVEGTSVISQTGGRGLEMTNSFSSMPQVRRFKGEMDATGTVFSFTEAQPSATARKIILRVPGRSGFTADVWDGSTRVETYSFTPATAGVSANSAQ